MGLSLPPLTVYQKPENDEMKKLLLLGSVLVLSACGGDGVSKSDLQEAINTANAENAVCLPYHLNVEHRLENENPADTLVGAPQIRLLKRQNSGKHANEAAMAQMEMLSDAGLYKKGKELRIGEGEAAIRYVVFDLTDKGSEQILASIHGPLLCVGHEKVDSINFYTEPSPANGVTLTQVSYQAKVEPERWARKLIKSDDNFAEIRESHAKTATLVKTNDGWRDIRDLRN